MSLNDGIERIHKQYEDTFLRDIYLAGYQRGYRDGSLETSKAHNDRKNNLNYPPENPAF